MNREKQNHKTLFGDEGGILLGEESWKVCGKD